MHHIENLIILFTAVIGMCAAVLVCFILIYPQINGDFSANKNNYQPVSAQSEDINRMPERADMQNYGDGLQSGESASHLTFTGDVREFMGLSGKEAFELSGDGFHTADRDRYITNEKNGMEIHLTNSIDNLTLFTVYLVRLNLDAGVSFYGIKVGDTLKDTDRILMDAGASYMGELKWILPIDDTKYQVNLATSDNQTIESMEAGLCMDPDPDSITVSDSYFSHKGDYHEFEAYWE